MVHENLLLPHLLDGVVVVALHGVVVLVDLDAQPAAGGEVIGLRQVAEAVVLHGLQDVLQAHPLGSLLLPFPSLRPDLVKAGDDESSSLDLHLQLQLTVDNLRSDLRLGHSEHLQLQSTSGKISRKTLYNLMINSTSGRTFQLAEPI